MTATRTHFASTAFRTHRSEHSQAPNKRSWRRAFKAILLSAVGVLGLGTAYAQFPSPYCAETFPSNVEPISFVQYAGISNTSSSALGGIAHENYTSIFATVTTGGTDSIFVAGNTDGEYINHIHVLIDWNQDGDFLDANETYFVGSIYNSTGTDGVFARGAIEVPETALPGTTRMRVWKKFNSPTVSICNNAGFGQAEDYSITVIDAPCKKARSISTTSIAYNTVNFEWLEPLTGPPSDGYDWEIRTGGDPGSGSAGLIASGSTVALNATVSTLNPATAYKIYVRANCGVEQSLWSTLSFSTPLVPADLQALQLQSPATNAIACYTTTPVTIRIKNAGSASIDLAAVDATVIATITDPLGGDVTFSIDTLTGSLAAGATRDVLMTPTYDMSIEGEYTFEAEVSMTGDLNPSNNVMPVTTRENALPSPLPQIVGFSGYGGTDATLPTGWKEGSGTLGGTFSFPSNGSFTTLSSAQTTAWGSGARMSFTGTNNGWIISPKVNIPAGGGHTFNFKAFLTTDGTTTAASWVAARNDSIKVLASTNCGVTWTLIDAFYSTHDGGLNSTATGFVNFSFPLTAFEGEDVQFAIYARRPTSSSSDVRNIIIKDVEITSCSAPYGLAVSGTTTATTNATWTGPSSGLEYEYTVVQQGYTIETAPVTYASGIVNTNSASITGLVPYINNYALYVRALCPETSSGWAGPLNFVTVCSAPSDAPTDMLLNPASTSVSGSFTKSVGGVASGYLVVRSSVAATPSPANGSIYASGASVPGGGTSIYNGTDSNFTHTGASSNTEYKYTVFAYNNTPCTGGPVYLTTSVLSATAVTCPAMPIDEYGDAATTDGFTVSWSNLPGGANPVTYDVQIARNAAFTLDTLTFYGVSAPHEITGLDPFTKYWFRVRGDNGCAGTWTSNAADTIRTQALGCTTPTDQPTMLTLTSNVAGTAIAGTFEGNVATNYLVVRANAGVIPTNPVDGTVYTVGATDVLGSGTTIVKVDTAHSFNNTGLSPNTTYDYYVFAFNHYSCLGGPKYNVAAPLIATDTTCTGAITGVTVTDISHNSMNINWTSLTGGGAAPVTYTVEVTTDAAYTTPVAGSPFSIADPTSTLTVTGLTPLTTYYYRIKANNIACENTWVNGSRTTKCDPPEITATTSADRCGPGTVTLSATADEPTATIKWYADSTSSIAIGTGNTFVTPIVYDTTTYYVGVHGEETILSVGNNWVSTSTSTTSTDAGVVFTTTQESTRIHGAQILVSGSGNMTFQLQNSAGTVLASTDVTVTAATTASLTTVSFPATFIAPVPATGYRLLCTSKSSGITWYYPSATHPVSTLGGEVTITSGWGWGVPEVGVARCVHKLDVGVSCVNPVRVPVKANVSESTPIVASDDVTICESSSAPLNVASTNPDYTYTWSPATGLSSTSGASVVASPSTSTAYFVEAIDPSGCTAWDTVIVTVNANPEAPNAISPTSATICEGDVAMLTVSPFAVLGLDTIGTGTSGTYRPLNRYYNYSASEMFYTKSELLGLGKIDSIGFKKVSGSNTAPITNVNIYIKNTTDSVPATGTSTTGYTLVYSGSYPNGAAGWYNVGLTAPFEYSGNNIAVLIVKEFATYLSTSEAPNWAYTSTGATSDKRRASYYQSDYTAWSNTSSMTLDYNRPNIRIKWSDKNDIQWSTVTGLYKDEDLTIPMGTTDTNTVVYASPTATTTYSVSSVDNGCLSPTSISSVVNVTSLSATTSGNTNPTTCGGDEGTISISGLSAGSMYSVSYTTTEGPVTQTDLSPDAGGNLIVDGLVAGTYTDLVVTENGGCSAQIPGTFTLTDPTSPVIVSTSSAAANCGIDNGKIIMNTSGVPAFSTHWVTYKKDGVAQADTVFNMTAGFVELESLAAGVYDSIMIQNSLTLCHSNYFGPLTITTTGLSDEIAPSTNDMNFDQGAGSTVSYTTDDCELIATIEATNGDLGTVSAQVTVGSPSTTTTGQPYMGRYYSFMATNNIGARVTIYLNQSDIDAYNALPEIGSEYPAIGSNLENLQFTVFHSLPGSGSGPLGYDDDPTTKEVISLGDMTIVAPTPTADYWTISFDLDSFSLVVPHSNSLNAPLPIKLDKISAVNLGATNRVNWNTLSEQTGDIFEVERSKNGQSFKKVGSIAANGYAAHYHFLDNDPFDGVNYYRLKLVNTDGSIAYSTVVSATVSNTDFNVEAYPNPVSSSLTVRVKGSISGKGVITLTDATGRLITTKEVEANGVVSLDMQHLAQGLYMVKYQDDVHSQIIKVDKK